jgi:hypothetical protein
MMDMLAPKNPVRPSKSVVMVTDAVYGQVANQPRGTTHSEIPLSQHITIRRDVIWSTPEVGGASEPVNSPA